MREAHDLFTMLRRATAAGLWALLLLSPAAASAQRVTAMWDPSPATDQVTAYQVCVGTASGSCNDQSATVPASETSYTFEPQGGVMLHVTVRAMNASGTGAPSPEARFSIPGFAQPAPRTGTVGTTISNFSFGITDPDGDTLTYTHTGLPPGLSLNSSTGRISGTPSSPGTYNVTMFVTDGLVTVSRTFTWTIDGAPSSDTTAPAIAVTSHTSGQTVSSTSVTVSGTATDSGKGGNGIVSVTVNGGAATGGTASGNGTANWSRALTLTSGSNTITVQATDTKGNVGTQQFTLTVNQPVEPVTGATLSSNVASPQNKGTAITFTAGGSGGAAPRQFKFLLQSGSGSAQVVQNWSTSTTWTWTPSAAGSYTVTVWARSAGVTTDAAQASAQRAFVINEPPPAPVSAATLAPNLASPQDEGTTISFAAGASGGVGPRQFKFLVRAGSGAVQTVRDWSTSTTYAWRPTAAGSYTVTVWARSAGVTADAAQAQAQVSFVIRQPVPKLQISLSGGMASPQAAGTPITFTASATGGHGGPYSFKWWLFDGSQWVMLRNWGTTATYTWTPSKAGSYYVGIWGRDAQTTGDVGDVNFSVPFVVSSPAPSKPPVRITGLTPSLSAPRPAGTSITWTAAATGGSGAHQFKWWVLEGGTWTMARNWSTQATFAWTPSKAGSYYVGVWARDAQSTADSGDVNFSVPYVVSSGSSGSSPVRIAGLTPNLSAPRAAGTSVTWTAGATGGSGAYHFKWWVREGNTWTLARDWSAQPTFNWTPSRPGTYYVGIWARDASVSADVSDLNYSVPFVVSGSSSSSSSSQTVTPQAAVLQALPFSMTGSPRERDSLYFTGAATGGTGSYQYKWWVNFGHGWELAQEWGTEPFRYIPYRAGVHAVGFWVRDSSTTADVGTVNYSAVITITP